MGAIKEIVEAIETQMTALGFTATDEMFDFDGVPDSIIDKAFRIETRVISNSYYPGHQANPIESVEIYIAYQLCRDPRSVWKTALDDRETIENDLVNASAIMALSSDPLLAMNNEATTQSYLADYLVSKLVFDCDYIRDISPA